MVPAFTKKFIRNFIHQKLQTHPPTTSQLINFINYSLNISPSYPLPHSSYPNMNIHHRYQNDLFENADLIMFLPCRKSSRGSKNLEDKSKGCCLALETPLDLSPAHLRGHHIGQPTVLWTSQALSSLCTHYSLSLECLLLCLPNKPLLTFMFLAQDFLSLGNHPWFLRANLAAPSVMLPYLLYWIVLVVDISFSSLTS